MAEIFVPTESDHLRAALAVSEELRLSAIAPREYFAQHLRSEALRAKDRQIVADTADLLVPRDMLTGEYLSADGSEQYTITMLGMAAGSLYVARMYRGVPEEADPVTASEALSVVNNITRYLKDTLEARRRNAVEQGTAMPDPATIGFDFDQSAYVGLQTAGRESRAEIDAWTDHVSPLVPLQPYFKRGVGLLLRGAQELSHTRFTKEAERQQREFAKATEHAHDVDWDKALARLLEE